MRIRFKIIVVTLLTTSSLMYVQAQENHAERTEAAKSEGNENPSGFYVGLQVNSPLFWGDLFSLGDKTRFGYGGGIFAGYTFNKWFSPELSFDYGVGRLGPKSHQLNDYINRSGILTYGQQATGDLKLGDLYSKTTYTQVGLRLQMGLMSLIRPDRYHRFDIELAPAIYAQKFSSKLYTVQDDKQWSKGTGGGDWNYAVGGDLGLRYRFSPKVSAHLGGGLLWMRNEAFEGVNNNPLWRVNLMANISAGVTFHLGKSARRTAAPVAVIPSVVDEAGAREAALARQRQEEQDRLAREAEARRQAELAAQREAEAKRAAYVKDVESLEIPSLFFRRGYADINLALYQADLDNMEKLAQKYPDANIVVEGWCDLTGTEAVNSRLSQQRAEALRDYLVSRGVSASRFISVKGMGVDKDGGYDQVARRATIRLIP